jgi:hypothetical protein
MKPGDIIKFAEQLIGRLSFRSFQTLPPGAASRALWGFPLLAGECEYSDHVIADASGMLWVVHDDSFYNNEHIFLDIIGRYGENENINVFTQRASWFSIAARSVESGAVARRPDCDVKVLGFLSRAATGTDDTKWRHIYKRYEVPGYSIAGRGLVYKIRAEVSLKHSPGTRKIGDTQLAFFDNHSVAYFRARFGAISQVRSISSYKKSREVATELLFRFASDYARRRK